MSPPAHSLGISAITENLLKRKWSLTILRYLNNGTHDPVGITHLETELPPSAMSERLRTMLRYQLILRQMRSGRPKVVEYRLTPKGRRLLNLLELINRLDRYPDHDPRSLDEILREEIFGGPKPPIILSATGPKTGRATKPQVLIA